MDVVIPGIAGASGLLAAGVITFNKIRPYIPITVNCWFCNTNSKVPFRRKNNFVCSSCKQYNGFSEDGDYNCDLPGQYCESLNSPPVKRSAGPPPSRLTSSPSKTDTPEGLSLGNGLCQTCNLYQAMKVKALAEFEPSHPDKFDEEVEVYEQRLERLYGGLCRLCNSTLKCTLGEQDSWLKPKLIHWRLQQSTIIKDLLTPLHSGMPRCSHFLSLLLRLCCVLLAMGICLSATLDTTNIIPTNTNINSIIATTTNNNATNNDDNQYNSQSPMNITDDLTHTNGSGDITRDAMGAATSEKEDSLLVSWVLVHCPWLLEYAALLVQHEAGAALLLLSQLLLAIAVAGRSRLKVWDALGCLVLVQLLAVCSCSSQLHLYLQPLYLQWVKSLLSCVACVCVCGSAAAAPSKPVVTALARHPRSKRTASKLDLSQESVFSNSSFNSSCRDDCTDDTAFSVQVSTAAPSVVSAASSAKPSVEAQAFINTTLRQKNARLMNNPFLGNNNNINKSASCGLLKLSTSAGGVAAGPSTSAGGVVAGPSTSGYNNNNVFGQSKFTLNRSVLGDSLDTSLGGLQIRSSAGHMDPVNEALASARNGFIHRSTDMNGMTLRSAGPGQSRLSQNINGIAQSSWVAGGYWGSPNKNNRSPPNNINNNMNYNGIRHLHQNFPHQPPLVEQPNGADIFPQSRSSSQSSGFVSHGSGSQSAVNVGGGVGPMGGRNDNDRVSVSSEPGFVWNYESCETASRSSQNLEDVFDPTVRQRRTAAYAGSDVRSVRSAATAPSSQYSSAAAASQYSNAAAASQYSSAAAASQYSSAAAASILGPHQRQQLWSVDQPVRNPYEDMKSMRALSRLSQHDISDDDLSMLSQRSIEVVTKQSPNVAAPARSPWVAFILGMSVMANGFLALVLYKNGTLTELLS